MENLQHVLACGPADCVAFDFDFVSDGFAAPPAGGRGGEAKPAVQMAFEYTVIVTPPAAEPALASAGGRNCVVTTVQPDPLANQAPTANTFVTLRDGKVVCSSGGPELLVWNPLDPEARPVAELEGHFDVVTCLLLVGGGEGFVSGSADGEVRVWNAADGACRFVLRGHTGKISVLVWLPELQAIASASLDGTVRVWDYTSGDYVFEMRGHNGELWAMSSVGRKRLVTGGTDAVLQLWNVQSGTRECSMVGHTAPVTALVAIGGGRVASGSWDTTVRVWNAVTGVEERLLEGHTGKVICLAAIGRAHVVSGSQDTTVRVWDCVSGVTKFVFRDHINWVTTILALGGGRVATGSIDNSLRFWDCEGGRCLRVLMSDLPDELYALSTGADAPLGGAWYHGVSEDHAIVAMEAIT